MVISVNKLKEEILRIRTLELTNSASLVLERIIWVIVAISGLVWFISFTSAQITLWNNHKTLVSKAKLKLSDIDYPATTFCSKSANKYGIAEQFGNHLDPNGNLDHEFLSWMKHKALECSLQKQNGSHDLHSALCSANPSYYPCQVGIYLFRFFFFIHADSHIPVD